MRRVAGLLALLLVGAATHGATQAIDLSRAKLVELTHPLDSATLFWPTSPTGFTITRLAYAPSPRGWFYSSNAIALPEHCGTHLDAPINFFEGGAPVDRIPLDRLVAPAVVIDVADSASRNPDYRLTPADVARFEKRHGRIAPGTIVLLRTGWDVRWPGRKAYFGDDTPGDASHLHFPSYGAEAARLLVEERKVAAIGVDVASIDYGPSVDFEVHRIAAAAGVPGFENLRGLEQVPARGAWVVALPALIRNGSGGPLRAIAIVPASR